MNQENKGLRNHVSGGMINTNTNVIANRVTPSGEWKIDATKEIAGTMKHGKRAREESGKESGKEIVTKNETAIAIASIRDAAMTETDPPEGITQMAMLAILDGHLLLLGAGVGMIMINSLQYE